MGVVCCSMYESWRATRTLALAGSFVAHQTDCSGLIVHKLQRIGMMLMSVIVMRTGSVCIWMCILCRQSGDSREVNQMINPRWMAELSGERGSVPRQLLQLFKGFVRFFCLNTRQVVLKDFVNYFFGNACMSTCIIYSMVKVSIFLYILDFFDVFCYFRFFFLPRC